MKKLFYLFVVVTGLTLISCSYKGKADSLAAELVNAQTNGYSSDVSRVEREIKEWLNDFPSEKSDEVVEYFENTLTRQYMKAFDEELSEIAEKIRGHLFSSIEYPYNKIVKKAEKLDKDYRKYAGKSISLYLSKSFNKELDGYANEVLAAIEKGNNFDIKSADKEFVKTYERISEKVREVGEAYKDAYEEILTKRFEKYVNNKMKEYENLCEKRDMEEAEKWLKDYRKEYEKLLNSASDVVKESYFSAVLNTSQEIMEKNDL